MLPIYFYLLFLGIGFAIGAAQTDSAKMLATGLITAIFGGLSWAAFSISDGSHLIAVLAGLILTAPVCVGGLLIISMTVDTDSIDYGTTSVISRTGTVSRTIDKTKAGMVKLDEPIGVVSEFPAKSKRHLPEGTRVIVMDRHGKRLVVQEMAQKPQPSQSSTA